LRLLADWQRAGLMAEVVNLARRLAHHLDLPEPLGSIISVPVDNAEAVRVDLARAGVKAAVRAGSVRVSPHVYTTSDEIDRTAQALAPFVRLPAVR
jgi:selenocysteine lyase/cysteine desulfurase